MNNPFLMTATRRYTNTKELLKRFFFLRVRLLPIVIFCATLLLTMKVSSLWHHLSQGQSPLEVRSVYAEEPAAAPAPAPPAPATQASQTGAPQKPPVNAPKASVNAADIDPMTLTPEALSTLLQIDQQKEQAPKKAGGSIHEQAIQDVINSEIQERSKSLSQTRKSLEEILSSVNQKESDNLKRVVQMVESMKPKEAAQRIEAMDFNSLVAIMEKVKPQKAALILTNMEPVKAGYLMTELSKRRIILQEGGAGAAGTAPQAPVMPKDAQGQKVPAVPSPASGDSKPAPTPPAPDIKPSTAPAA
ncbi:MAG: hypothetical protein C0514_06010 [Candidatus Puniceispirillum sp.]|nr:hypothetical protein [Candidatus Puniceispirillum sp.]